MISNFFHNLRLGLLICLLFTLGVPLTSFEGDFQNDAIIIASGMQSGSGRSSGRSQSRSSSSRKPSTQKSHGKKSSKRSSRPQKPRSRSTAQQKSVRHPPFKDTSQFQPKVDHGGWEIPDIPTGGILVGAPSIGRNVYMEQAASSPLEPEPPPAPEKKQPPVIIVKQPSDQQIPPRPPRRGTRVQSDGDETLDLLGVTPAFKAQCQRIKQEIGISLAYQHKWETEIKQDYEERAGIERQVVALFRNREVGTPASQEERDLREKLKWTNERIEFNELSIKWVKGQVQDLDRLLANCEK